MMKDLGWDEMGTLCRVLELRRANHGVGVLRGRSLLLVLYGPEITFSAQLKSPTRWNGKIGHDVPIASRPAVGFSADCSIGF